MTVDVSNQAVILTFCLFGGIFIGIIYDFFRLSRKFFKMNTTMVAVEDLIFWLLCSVIVFITSLKLNSGEIRWFMFLGYGAGALLYFLTISRLFMKIFVFLLNIIKILLHRIFIIIFTPVRLLFKLVNRPIFFVLNFGIGRFKLLAEIVKKPTKKIQYFFKKLFTIRKK